MTSSPNRSLSGQSVLVTATVSGSDGGGTVGFTDSGGRSQGCGAVGLDGSGQATCTSSSLSAGDVVLASYSGDSGSGPSSGS
ncbi:MAG: Ig-like domain repeat protein [Actinomycetota bacterium]